MTEVPTVGLARQVLHDGVGRGRERYGDQRTGDSGDQDAAADRQDHAERELAEDYAELGNEPPTEEALKHE